MDQTIALFGHKDQCYGNGAELHTERNSNMKRKEERAGSIWLKTDRTGLGVLLPQTVSSSMGLAGKQSKKQKTADEGGEPGQRAGCRVGWLCSSE